MIARGGRHVTVRVVLMFASLFVSVAARAEDAPHGLAWNRSGLPAVFPLQVKTREGQDFFLTLETPDTGAAAMGAHIDGGRFFKLLVPPGAYRLRFDPTGRNAADREAFLLHDPLIFEVYGSSKKVGHIVDITGLSATRLQGAEIRAQSICQVIDRDFEPRFPGVEFDDAGKPLPMRPRDWSEYPSVGVRAFYCD